ncbi:MAG: ABC transporter substrate-binding protein [Candidatus Odinarchaeota archaeon]
MKAKKLLAFLPVAAMIALVLMSGCTAPKYEKTTIDVYYNTGNTTRETACLLLKESIEALDVDGDGKAGDIKINVETVQWAEYLDQLGDRDKIAAYVLDWGPDYADPDPYIVQYLACNVGGTYAYWNSYNNSVVNSWIADAAASPDKMERAALYAQVEAQAAADAAFIPLYQALAIRTERDEVDGFSYNPMFGTNDLYFMRSKNAATQNNVSTIVKEWFGAPQYLDPGIDYENAGGEILANVYENLITYEGYWQKADAFMPLLAESMPVWNEAGDQCNISIRSGITFHDGTPFNASSVKYSWDRAVIINDPDGPNWLWGGFAKGGPDYMDSNGTDADVVKFMKGADGDISTPDQFVTVVNENMVTVTLDAPYVPFESIMAYTIAAVISPTFDMKNYGNVTFTGNFWADAETAMKTEALASPGYMADHTCGTGPYELVVWNKGTNLVLKAYDDYWGGVDPVTFAPRGASWTPSITSVNIVQNDETSSRVASIAAGDADIIIINAADAQLVTKEEGAFATWGDASNEVYPKVNVTVGLPSWSVVSLFLNHALEPFDDLNARLGVAYAFPYDKFITQAVRGHGIPMHGTIPKGMFGQTDAFPYVYDAAKAIDYFKAAGVGMPEEEAGISLVDFNAGLFFPLALALGMIVTNVSLRRRK